MAEPIPVAHMTQITTPTPAQWDAFVKKQPHAHILQLSYWGAHQAAFGWSSKRVALTNEQGELVAGTQILFRKFPFNIGTRAYIPFGPYVSKPEQWQDLWSAIHTCAKEQGAIYLKWEPGILADEQPLNFRQFGFQASTHPIQPPRTILIDIDGTDEVIMARMNQGTRRKIRKSLKNNSHYYEASPSDLVKFTSMMNITGDRNEFFTHPPSYYEKAYELFVPEYASLILAEHEGDVLAGIMVFAVGKTAWYLYGASSNHKRNLMASYGVQWHAIQWAKAHGCKIYDMWGVPDEDWEILEAQFQERSDGLWGVYGFKRGWGGEVVRSAGTWDYVYNPVLYRLYHLAKRLRG